MVRSLGKYLPLVAASYLSYPILSLHSIPNYLPIPSHHILSYYQTIQGSVFALNSSWKWPDSPIKGNLVVHVASFDYQNLSHFKNRNSEGGSNTDSHHVSENGIENVWLLNICCKEIIIENYFCNTHSHIHTHNTHIHIHTPHTHPTHTSRSW